MKVGARVKALTTNMYHEKGDLGTMVLDDGTKLMPYHIQWDKDEKGITEPCNADELEIVKSATLEIYKTKKGLSYRKIASNGKILNHQYNTMAGLKKGIEAEKRFWSNYKIVKK